MVNPHEEQLLSELLTEIAREDARLDASHLENRVCEAYTAAANRNMPSVGLVERSAHPTSWSRIAIAGLAAAAILTVLVSQSLRPAPAETEVVVATDRAESFARSPIAKSPVPQSPIAKSPIAQPPTIQSTLAHASLAQSPFAPIPPSPIAQEFPSTQSPIPQSPMEFIPLTPFSSDDLSGSFQIMRVQLPRASLGPPRSPFEQPHELVEADVLLGEDGTARAIHVSSSQQFQPWRPR
jgi:hypothetical protein